MTAQAHLIFVYNADSGLYNTLADAAHKVLAPTSYSCNLCQVTYGWFTERRDWRAFIAGLDAECEFLHRDQFHRRFPNLDIPLPAVLQFADAEPRLCIDAARLNACRELGDLIGLVRERCLP